jgi:hypothetical protein
LERRAFHEGMVSVGGKLYSVPEATRKGVVEVHTLADEVRIFEDGRLIDAHPALEGRHQRQVAAGHRKMPRGRDHQDRTVIARPHSQNAGRFEDSQRRSWLVSLIGHAPALEVLDQTVRRLERGEASDTLFAEELTLRENRRAKMVL